MTINKGNKLLYVILIILIILVLIFYFMPDEWLLKLDPVKGKYRTVSKNYNNMKQNFMTKNSLEERKQNLLNEIKRLNIETEIFHENIISDVYEQCINNNIEISKIVFSEVTPVSLNNNAEILTEENNDKMEAMTLRVTLEFKCEYENMLKFIDDIKNDNINIAVSHMRLLSWNSNEVYGVIDLNFYAIPLKIDI